MNRSMEYVYQVYLEKNFSKAAEKLYVSQPALSTTIKKVEEALGIALFDRRTTPICLTPAGECYIHATEQIMEIEKKLAQDLNTLLGKNSGTISIGGATFFCAHILPSIIQSFNKKYPGYTVNLLEGNAKDLATHLQRGDLDISLDVELLDEKIFNKIVWQEEHIVLAVPVSYKVNDKLSDFRLTFDDICSNRYSDANFPSVSMHYFEHYPFVFLKKGNDMFRRGMTICKNAGFVPKVPIYFDQLLTSYYVACDGKGIAFVRAGITRYVETTKKVFFYKIDDKNAVRNIMLYHKKNSLLSLPAQDFISFLTRSLD